MTGIYRRGRGWRAVVSQGRGRPLIRKQFPADGTLAEMQAWRKKTAATVALRGRASAGTLAFDCEYKYFPAVKALTTFKERTHELQGWLDAFGHRQRDTIQPHEIRRVRDEWLSTPRAPGKPPLSPATVNKRLWALSNVYTVLDGPRGLNPVREVPQAREPTPQPKALDYETIDRILAALPDRGQGVKAQKRTTTSLTKIRLRCMAYCAITPKQLGELRPEDIDLEAGRLRQPARHKGAGAPAVWVPLLPQARAAFRDFVAANAFGKFSQSSVRKSFSRAAKAAGVTEHVWPYRLRHSFGTMLYLATGSLEATGRLMQHTNKSTTLRYAIGAEQDVMAATVAALATALRPKRP